MIERSESLIPSLETPSSRLPSRTVVATRSSASPRFSFYEFFAGGGMARAGLGPGWQCLFANDFDLRKAATYKENWGGDEIVAKDVKLLKSGDLPGRPDLIWASFPCQDLSLAGMGAGLRGDRSGTFWPFWKLVSKLATEGRGPRVLVLENVCGTLTSHDGKDFAAIANALADGGYRFGAIVVDAADFLPQSRPRLFVIALAEGSKLPEELSSATATAHWHPRALRTAHEHLSKETRSKWIWWNLPTPPTRTLRLSEVVEDNPADVPWHTPEETAKLLGMMSEVNLAKVDAAKKTGRTLIGTVYKRTRRNERGTKVQRAEIRFDGLAGCLRTSAGGSSRQVIVVVKGSRVRSRLLSSRETARLMGLPETYVLPKNYNEAYHLTGDGVVVPVVRFLAANLLERLAGPPLLADESLASPPLLADAAR